ncbi:4-aminobutyrate aminotransferase/(S)-3-amino-2-methylpropionate transaminase [Povalibacter uvarum]|uniref:4-aminobutyrate aminotransferase/(S)-3-amino-2-methylpropionate transaminase n=1 Tax=Povalibacter uvarum TaxID=732238 RepID=A0A841HGP6_9GAMM|nr:4-aminobutyrate--2-oxoglutarate transaminase [Povalibacter uvarum]MBB6091946.1 4-aminobutyrate aminotransferase/(S)-3-amino-2-methylpropionate transaminase [Povalibacter uvarum]
MSGQPSPQNQALHERRNAAISRGMSTMLPVYVKRAQNAELWDEDGRRYVDFAGGIAVVNTGHVHPRVKEAVLEQLDAFTHTCVMITPYRVAVELAEKLNSLVPGPSPKKTMFVTTGAEAVENAIKIARAHTGRPAVIAFGGGFHGRTFMAMALTGKVTPYKVGFGPFPGDVFHAPFPIEYHGVSVEESLAAIDQLFKYVVEPSRVAAIIVEPVLGEGGFYAAPKEFLQQLRKLCDQHGIVFIADEIQTGFGRTGRMFAMEHHGIEADLTTMAKSLAGGFPLAAIVGKSNLMDAPVTGGLGGTYAASPVGCAAALAVIDVMQKENLCQRAEQIGVRVKARLGALQKSLSCIGDVRGPGAMIAMELVKNRDAHSPDADLAKALVQRSAQNGLVLLSCGVYSNVIRFLMPLTASDAIIDEGLDILERSLREIVG